MPSVAVDSTNTVIAAKIGDWTPEELERHERDGLVAFAVGIDTKFTFGEPLRCPAPRPGNAAVMCFALRPCSMHDATE